MHISTHRWSSTQATPGIVSSKGAEWRLPERSFPLLRLLKGHADRFGLGRSPGLEVPMLGRSVGIGESEGETMAAVGDSLQAV